MSSIVLPDACASLFFHSNSALNTTISAADLKQGANNLSYAYSPSGYAVAHIGLEPSANGTENTPDSALQALLEMLDTACSFPFDKPAYPIAWDPSFGGQPRPVSSIIIDGYEGGFISLLDRKEGYLNSNSFTAYPGCLYKTNDLKIRANGTAITPANLTEIRPVAFNASAGGFAKPYFSEGYVAKYSVALAPGGASASPTFTIDVAASNLTSSMDLQKEAWLCFQMMYSRYMSKNETLPYHCNGGEKATLPRGWLGHWPCYTGNQKNDTREQYCACEVTGTVQTTSAASSHSSVVMVFLSLLMLSFFV
ncbi:hypothetical protein BJ741DRAFT_615758 [Chytriomyces cf. hyalinus JEL632]|nr:hypothetical protein BJ741DRAFT_615758 [Chytriomyces cf. hyalinus JEL632]